MFIIISFIVSKLVEEIKQTEQSLQKSERHYRRIFNSINDGIFILDLEKNKFTDVNNVACRRLGYAREEFLTMNPDGITLPENKDKIDIQIQKTLKKGYNRIETAYLKKDGDVILIELRSTIIEYDGKKMILSLVRDISERKAAEEAKIKLEDLVRSSNEGIIGETLEGIVETWNRGAEKIYGYTSDEMLGNQISILIPENRIPEFDEIIGKIKKGDRVEQFETERKRKDGKIINVSLTVSPIKTSDGKITGASIIARDFTEKIKIENQLRHSQKLEAIGALAGGIAHDFNNILFPIMGYAEMTRDYANDNSIKNNMEQIILASERARKLVEQILTFSRQKEEMKKPVQIKLIVKEVIKLLKASFPSTIAIKQSLMKDTPYVLADTTQIHQIVMNLCTNAYYAMREKGGTLEIKLKEIQLTQEDIISEPDLIPGLYILLTVADTGTGIERHLLERIFESYFTTKPVGEGTGLGLSTVHGIVKSFGGKISVYSEIGQGTTFNIYLPCIKAETNIDFKTIDESIPTGTEHILVLDDETAIIDILTSSLQYLGYKVTSKSNGIEGIELFKSNPNGFDVIITDMTMPKMTGINFAREVLKIRPDIPIILCTGFSEIITEEAVKSMGIREFIMKPILKKEIANVLRKVLN
ncbi:MAG: PAS domain S-box protein [Desulfobacterales bacterium]|nr:PAS domain S-box protein [Desulfobacterales bacterium]